MPSGAKSGPQKAEYSSHRPLVGGIKVFYLVKLRSELVAIIAICVLKVQINEVPYNPRHAYIQTCTRCQNRSAPLV